MSFLATTKANIHRPITSTTKDAHGDYIETLALRTSTPIAFSLIEKRRSVWDAATETLRTVRYYAGRCSPAVDIRTGDRVTDVTTTLVYVVDETILPSRGLAGHASLSVELRLLGDRIVP